MSALNIEMNTQANNAGVPPAPPEGSSNRQVWKVEKRKFSVPGDFVPVELEGDLPEGVEVWRDPVNAIAAGFSGKRGKPDWYYRFKNEERMQQHIEAWLQRLQEAEAWKAQRKAEAKAKAAEGHGCKVGDVFVCSWGYDQTNVDYYEVVALHGTTMATVRRIGCQSEGTGYLMGQSVPAPGQYLEQHEPQRVRITAGNPASFKAYSFASAYKMQPVEVAGIKVFKTHHWSAYA